MRQHLRRNDCRLSLPSRSATASATMRWKSCCGEYFTRDFAALLSAQYCQHAGASQSSTGRPSRSLSTGVASLKRNSVGAVHVERLTDRAVLIERLHDAVHDIARVRALPQPGIAVPVMVVDEAACWDRPYAASPPHPAWQGSPPFRGGAAGRIGAWLASRYWFAAKPADQPLNISSPARIAPGRMIVVFSPYSRR